MLNRRDVLKSLGASAVATGIPGVAFASTETDARFVLVVLRGAVDGLAFAAPYGDPNYQKVRGELALAKPGTAGGLLKLDGFFGLNPSLPNIHASYGRNEAAIIHAVAGPYRERSHFDGQDMLESGGSRVGGLRDGWLNRALLPIGSRLGNEAAIALAQNTPLVLRGDNSVISWAPSRLPDADENTIARLQNLYADDEFFSTRLRQALHSQEIANQDSSMPRAGQRNNDSQQFAELMQSAARFLTTPDGPGIAVVEFGGWDTHANQGAATGALANRLQALDTGLGELRNGMGDSWDKTVVAVATEFGRTVHVNGTRGTDHGTGTAALLMGGAVNGGKVVSDWPGLGKYDLYAGRDLKPTTDIRSVFKAILSEHLKLPDAYIENRVFPDSAGAVSLQNLLRG